MGRRSHTKRKSSKSTLGTSIPSSTSVSKTTKSADSSTARSSNPPRVWENIISHYLSKLRNVWTRRPVTKSTIPKQILKKSKRSPQSNANYPMPTMSHFDKRAFNIVNDAVAYGMAKGVVKRDGRYFYLPTYGEDKPLLDHHCRGCPQCNMLINTNCPLKGIRKKVPQSKRRRQDKKISKKQRVNRNKEDRRRDRRDRRGRNQN